MNKIMIFRWEEEKEEKFLAATLLFLSKPQWSIMLIPCNYTIKQIGYLLLPPLPIGIIKAIIHNWGIK